MKDTDVVTMVRCSRQLYADPCAQAAVAFRYCALRSAGAMVTHLILCLRLSHFSNPPSPHIISFLPSRFTSVLLGEAFAAGDMQLIG